MSAISDYFRTALLIDDRVAADYRALEQLGGGSTRRLYEEPTSDLHEPLAEDETPVRPADLVRAFLASGVVCSVLETEEEPSDLTQQVLKGALIADLLILDWLMPRANPMTIKAIDEVATKHPERLTVIVVFTGAHSLSGVVQRLIDECRFETIDEFVVRRNNTVVLVFGKPGPKLTGHEDRRQPGRSYRDLPEMICDDLDLIFKGLMPEFAFSGINALRESAPRILATFNEELDAGALIHRALLPDPDEAAMQFIRLLCSDMELALRDADVTRVWDVDASSDALARVAESSDAASLAATLRRSPKLTDDFEALDDDSLVKRAIADGFVRIGLGDSAISKAITDLEAAMAESRISSENLAVLMDSSGFGNTPPRLELGVVVRDAEERYWLCVQPLCDSVRLREPRAFPLIPVCVDASKPEAMIRLSDGTPAGISFVTNLHQLVMVRFAPNDAKAVVAAGTSPNWYFTDEKGTRYCAITRLRPDLAAHVVHTLGAAATRIGPDQSEWLRRGGLS